MSGFTKSRYWDTVYRMELYHALNRGVEKRALFLNDKDRMRFVHDLYEFNDITPAPEFVKCWDFVNPDIHMRKPRKCIVEIHGWCIMENHYHLLLSELIDGGISLFLRKLNVGYANYFNEKYKRSGTLFQGRTKRILIDSDAHFLHILHYIHLNPLDLHKSSANWRERKIENAAEAVRHLENYRWSSFLDYTGKRNFPSVITTELFGDVFRNYGKALALYLKDIELAPIEQFLLEHVGIS